MVEDHPRDTAQRDRPGDQFLVTGPRIGDLRRRQMRGAVGAEGQGERQGCTAQPSAGGRRVGDQGAHAVSVEHVRVLQFDVEFLVQVGDERGRVGEAGLGHPALTAGQLDRQHPGAGGAHVETALPAPVGGGATARVREAEQLHSGVIGVRSDGDAWDR